MKVLVVILGTDKVFTAKPTHCSVYECGKRQECPNIIYEIKKNIHYCHLKLLVLREVKE